MINSHPPLPCDPQHSVNYSQPDWQWARSCKRSVLLVQSWCTLHEPEGKSKGKNNLTDYIVFYAYFVH